MTRAKEKIKILWVNLGIIVAAIIIALSINVRAYADKEELEEEVKEEIKNFIEKIISDRNKAIVTGEREGIKVVYDMATKYGQWAFESEEKKMIYLHNWEQKQGVKITEIVPKVVVTRIKEKEEGGFM